MKVCLEYAQESCVYLEEQGATDLQIIKTLTVTQTLDLAEKLGDEKITSIVATMKASTGYKKITDAQKHAVATALLAAYGTARKVLAVAFDTTTVAMFNEEQEEQAEVLEGIELDSKFNVAYGIMSTFTVEKDSAEDKDGNTYKASKAAIRDINLSRKNGKESDTFTVKIGNELIAVTINEAKSLGLIETGCKWYSAPVGRPAEVGGKKVTVYLNDEAIASASKIGDGNVSEGIRKALAAQIIESAGYSAKTSAGIEYGPFQHRSEAEAFLLEQETYGDSDNGSNRYKSYKDMLESGCPAHVNSIKLTVDQINGYREDAGMVPTTIDQFVLSLSPAP